MWADPKEVLKTVPLRDGGMVHLGYNSRTGGQTVGTASIMAKVTGRPDFEEIWFYPDRYQSVHLLISKLESEDEQEYKKIMKLLREEMAFEVMRREGHL